MPTVSVILPAYNSASFIRQTVESVIDQTFPDWELLIVNDGSTDSTSDQVRNIDPRVRLIERANGGIAAARNVGIEAARGEFIAFLDHDDYWHPEKLHAQLKAVRSHPECGVIYGEFKNWDPKDPPIFPEVHLNPEQINLILSGWIYHLLPFTNWVLFSTALCQRRVFERVGVFDVELPPADDWDMAVRISRHYPFLKLAQIVTLYRSHPGQTSRRLSEKDHESEFRARIVSVYGLTGPDGSRVDEGELRERRFRAHLRHSAAHVRNGDPRVAVRSAWQAIRVKPASRKAWLHLLAGSSKVLSHLALRPWQRQQ